MANCLPSPQCLFAWPMAGAMVYVFVCLCCVVLWGAENDEHHKMNEMMCKDEHR